MQNKTLIQFFEWYCHGGATHWKKFKNEIPKLVDLGFTAAWLPPAYKGTRGPMSEGYDVYDIYDLGEFDQKGSVATKYGTKEEYIDSIRTARDKGLEVYVDIVLNHMGGAEETEKVKARKVDESDRTKFTSDTLEIEAYTKFTFPGRGGKYSTFQWDHQCFTGVDHAVNTGENGIYTIINEYGEDWEPLTHAEKGNFDYLMLNDIETRNPAVRDELKRWIHWYYLTVPFDGVRLDAVKHINPGFFIEWIDYIRKELNPFLFVLGEFWLSDDLPVLLKYIDVTGGRMSLFDAPLHRNLSQASIYNEQYDLRNIFRNTLIGERPDLAVTFVDNHDTQPLQSLEEYTEQWFKPHAYTLILLRELGYPCVFYADLYGACYCDKNKEGNECEIEIPPLECLPTLLEIRKNYAYGEQQDYFDDPNCIGWVRRGADDIQNSGCAVLISNHPFEIKQKRMNMSKGFAGKQFQNVLGQGSVEIDEEGWGLFEVNPASVSVWIPKK